MATQELALPHYPELIFAAIKAIDEKNGANKSAISKHIESTSDNLPAAHSTLLSHHLNKMKAAGQLIIVKNNYIRSDSNAAPRRGRGRPRKPKDTVVSNATALSPAKETDESPAPDVSVSGRKRGRPRKVGVSTVKASSPPVDGERREEEALRSEDERLADTVGA